MNKTFFVLAATTIGTLQFAQAGCNEGYVETTPTSEFVINGDGTATHMKTGLQWLQCAQGQSYTGTTCTGSGAALDWQTALNQAENSEYAGYSDWRLPNIKELRSIMEYCTYMPTINNEVFHATPNLLATDYWSSTPHATYPDDVWTLSFYQHNDSYENKDDFHFVRLVRDAE